MLNRKKHLGQHFLNNKKSLEEMARAAEISKNDIVLEVGPGLGSLTEILAARAKKVIAVEKDRELIPILRERFRNYKNVEIIQGDILKIENWKVKIGNFKVVANLPYYITSRFLRLFLSQTEFGSKLMVLMVQKEVAERICAKPPKMNLLALSVQLYAKPEIIRKVSKGQFSPPPKVDSAIIKISLRRPTSKSEQILALAKIAFQQKRKMLRHSLKHVTCNIKHETRDSSFMLHDSRFNRRPEELSLEDWSGLTQHLLIKGESGE